MINIKFLKILSLLLIFTSCANSKQQKNQEIINEIFSQIVLDFVQDQRTLINPSIEQLRKPETITKKRLNEKGLLIYNDSILENVVYLKKQTSFEDLSFEYLGKVTEKIDQLIFLEIDKTNSKNVEYIIIGKSEYKDKINEYSKNPVIGNLGISPILMNPKGDEGFLFVSFICGDFCSYTFKINIIKNNEGKWNILKSQLLSIT